MRFNLILLLAAIIFAVSCFDIANAKEEVTIKAFDDMGRDVLMKIKGNPGKLRGRISAATNENAIVKLQESGKLIPTSAKNGENAIVKYRGAGQLVAKNGENAIVKYRGAGELVSKSAKNWDDVIGKIESGAKLKPLDTTSGNWKSAFDQLKATGQLKNVDEKQAAKLTGEVAQEVVKNPSKWRYVKKILEITFGAVLAALIIVGFDAMIS